MRRHAPRHLSSDLFLRTINHVKILIVLDADNEFVRLILNAARNVTVRKVSLSKRHKQLESTFVCISFKFSKKHAVVAAETNLSLARSHNNVKDCVYF